MEVKYEYLEMIPEIKELLIRNTSPYLSKKELCEYLKISESFLKQSLLHKELLENMHFFKIGEAKILFDKEAIDEWVRARKEKNLGKPLQQKQQTVHEYLSSWQKSHKVNGA